MQKDQKDKDSEFDSFVFWVFLHDFNDSKDLMRIRLYETMLSARSPIAIFKALIYLEETSSQDKEARITNVFQTYSPRRASYGKASQGRKYYLLTISFSPDNSTFTCNLCQDKMQKGLGKRFHQLAKFPYKIS